MSIGSFSIGGGSVSGGAPSTAAASRIYWGPAGTSGYVMNLGSMVTEAQRVAGRVDAGFDARTRNWINQAFREWQKRVPTQLVTTEQDFTLQGNLDLYLPTQVAKINYVVDVTNKSPVNRTEDWDRRDPAAWIEETGGKAVAWREVGVSPVAKQPSSASQVFFTPQAPEAVVCFVQGLASDTTASNPGMATYLAAEYVTCPSSVETSGSIQFTKIHSISKSAQTSGDITVSYTSAGETVARLFRDDYRSEYRHIQLLNVPTDGTQIRVSYSLYYPPLSDDNQVPPPGVDSDFLIYKAASKIHKAQGQNEDASAAIAMAEAIIRDKTEMEKTKGDQFVDITPDTYYWNPDE